MQHIICIHQARSLVEGIHPARYKTVMLQQFTRTHARFFLLSSIDCSLFLLSSAQDNNFRYQFSFHKLYFIKSKVRKTKKLRRKFIVMDKEFVSLLEEPFNPFPIASSTQLVGSQRSSQYYQLLTSQFLKLH